MKLSIIHLSDMHLTVGKDFFVSRLTKLGAACRSVVNEADRIYVAISGDIVNTGSEKEYKVAESFLLNLKIELQKDLPNKSVEFILVPGNHDCSLKEQDQARSALVASALANDEIDKNDTSVIDICYSAQKNFWNFYTKITGRYPYLVSDAICFPVSEKKQVLFRCYNTSIFSQYHECPGKLMVPTNYLLGSCTSELETLSITMYHHNSGWLSSNTPNNNKKQFEKDVLAHSNIVLCGHEHEVNGLAISKLNKESLFYFEGAAAQYNKSSEFSIIKIDTDSNTLQQINFRYHHFENANLCRYDSEVGDVQEIHTKTAMFSFRSEYEKELLRFSIPLTHPSGEIPTLSDLYVFPDLEPISKGEEEFVQYVDAADIVDWNTEHNVTIFEGGEQCGKTALLKMYAQRFISKHIYPILLEGSSSLWSKLDKIIEKQYAKQYQTDICSFDNYAQLGRGQKVILIDNFDEVGNTKAKNHIINKLLLNYAHVYVVVDRAIDMADLLATGEIEIKVRQFHIHGLASEKRSELIENWYRFGQDILAIDEEMLDKAIKDAFERIDTILGDEYMPSYPIYLLSLLQSLSDTSRYVDLKMTYYAYCYDSLIKQALYHQLSEHEKAKGYFNFLIFLAGRMFCTKQRAISKEDLKNINEQYGKVYLPIENNEKVIATNLCESNLLVECDEDTYVFAYKYIYYYLASLSLAKRLSTKEGKDELVRLCNSLYENENANVLVFLAYHKEDDEFISNLILSGMFSMDRLCPVSLEIEDPLFNELNKLAESVKDDVVQEADYKEIRKKELQERDKRDLAKRKAANNYGEMSLTEEEKAIVRNLNQSYSTIKILGQIVKNQKNSLTKEQILDIVETAYNVGFRTIRCYSQLFEQNKKAINESLLEQYQKDGHLTPTGAKIQETVNKMLTIWTMRLCLNVFSIITRSIGTSNINTMYDEVATRIGTPAAKLVSFTIKTCYGKMNATELDKLYKEMEGNSVAQYIIRARVHHYLYHNKVDYSDKARIMSACNLHPASIKPITHLRG